MQSGGSSEVNNAGRNGRNADGRPSQRSYLLQVGRGMLRRRNLSGRADGVRAAHDCDPGRTSGGFRAVGPQTHRVGLARSSNSCCGTTYPLTSVADPGFEPG